MIKHVISLPDLNNMDLDDLSRLLDQIKGLDYQNEVMIINRHMYLVIYTEKRPTEKEISKFLNK